MGEQSGTTAATGGCSSGSEPVGPQETVETFAHRMRSHVQVLLGYAELLHDDIHLDKDDPAAAYLSAMRRTVDQIGRAVDNLVAEYFEARLPLPNPEPVASQSLVSGRDFLNDRQSVTESPRSATNDLTRNPINRELARDDGVPSQPSATEFSLGQDG